MEVCYQLHSIAPLFALELPKKIEQLSDIMLFIQSIQKNQKPPKSAFKSLNRSQTHSTFGRYLVITGIPKIMTENEFTLQLKRSLAVLNGLKVIEIQFNIDKHCAVVQLQTSELRKDAKDVIAKTKPFLQTSHLDVHQETGTVNPFIVSTVGSNLKCDESECEIVWADFLKSKMFKGESLNLEVKATLRNIFESSLRDPSKESMKFSDLLIKRNNNFLAFLNGLKNRPPTDVRDDLRDFFDTSKDAGQDEIVDTLTIEGVFELVLRWSKEDPASVVKGFHACNYDCNMKNMGSINASEDNFTSWSLKEYLALVDYLNESCSRFNQKFQDIQASEFQWGSCEMNTYDKSVLEDKSEEDIRSRICFLVGLNHSISSEIIPFINFDSKQGLATDLSVVKNLFFTSWKMSMLDNFINGTVQKNEDQPGVSVTVNPIDNLSKSNENLTSTWFFQSYQILSEINSSNFCTQLPHSDDPQFPILIKMVGEEVQGNSGSFRQFLARIIEEIHGTTLPLFMPYMNNGPFKGMYQVHPSPLNILTEKLYIYFGQILGMAVRSGIPLPIGMMPHFWKVLIDCNEAVTDSYLASYDPDLNKYLLEIQSNPCQESFDLFVEEHQYPNFVWQSIAGEEVELVNGGKNIQLDFNNRLEYIQLIKAFRTKELECKEKMNCILAVFIPFFLWDTLEVCLHGRNSN